MVATFRAAAEAVKAKQAQAALSTEQRILHHLRKWCKAWGDDLDARPAHVKDSGAGAPGPCCPAALPLQHPLIFLAPGGQPGVRDRRGAGPAVSARTAGMAGAKAGPLSLRCTACSALPPA